MNNNLSSNSVNTNSFSKKSRNKKHSEDFSIRSVDHKVAHNDARDLQIFSLHFFPDNMTANSKQQSSKVGSSSKQMSSNVISPKQLTKKILERIETEQKNENTKNEGVRSFKSSDSNEEEEYEEEEKKSFSTSKSFSEIENEIMHTLSNKHSTSQKMDNNYSVSDSFNEVIEPKPRISKKKVTFNQNKVLRAKTFDMNMHCENESNPSKSQNNNTFQNDSHSSSDRETKKKIRSPERIYDILKNKQEVVGVNKIFKNIAVTMLVNHFIKQMKMKSGRFGMLGNRQLKILNDFSYPINTKIKNNELEHNNILVRLIKKNELIQKTLKKSNFFKKYAGNIL